VCPGASGAIPPSAEVPMLPIITDWPRPRHAEALTGAEGRQLPGA
jgi:hypothetical protein